MDTEEKQDIFDKSKALFLVPDAIVNRETIDAAQQFVDAGGPPFTIISSLVDSYNGYAEMTNKLGSEVFQLLGINADSVILDAVKDTLTKKFDPIQIDGRYPSTEALPEWVDTLTGQAYWRKVFYDLSENHTQCSFVSRVIQSISEKGYQNEMTSLSTASMYTHVYYTMLSEAIERLQGVSDDDLKYRFGELVDIGGQREFMYFMTKYILRSVRKRYGKAALPIARLEEDLERYVMHKNRSQALIGNIHLLINDLPVGSKDQVAKSIAMIIKEQRAKPGDVIGLSKTYREAYDHNGQHLPAELLRDPVVMEPLLQELFEFYGNTAIGSESLPGDHIDHYIWLIAYATSYSEDIPKDQVDSEMKETMSALKTIRRVLNAKMTTININRAMSQILKWIDIPITAMVVASWVQALIKDDQYSFYQMYYRSTEIPVPLMILEEIAYRHPLLQQHIFRIYLDSFETRVPNMMSELELSLQKMILDRLLGLIQMGHIIPILRYIHRKQVSMDESQVVYFISKLLEIIDQPYPAIVVEFMLHIINRVVHALVMRDAKDISNLRCFLEAVEKNNGSQIHGEIGVDYIQLAAQLRNSIKNK
ncbi:hypothetical protein H4219_002220 [Mycoemilia scoparia]|uniref:TH1 protein n=1 Tax=Mycoemilia scoparia TaxID=417184 RepID=A0A9W8A3X5_9FUNG|nr:hypothetical protein H4219_002220 [Mycoemilia scoparia]